MSIYKKIKSNTVEYRETDLENYQKKINLNDKKNHKIIIEDIDFSYSKSLKIQNRSVDFSLLKFDLKETENKNKQKENLLNESSGLLNKFEKNISQAKKTAKDFSKYYKKFMKLSSVLFLGVAISTVPFQANNVYNIAKQNDFSWQQTKEDFIDYYKPYYNDIRDRNIYNICKRDESLCVASGAIIAYSMTRGYNFLSAGAGAVAYCSILEDCSGLEGIISSIEDSFGWTITEKEKMIPSEITNSNEIVANSNAIIREKDGYEIKNESNKYMEKDKDIDKMKNSVNNIPVF